MAIIRTLEPVSRSSRAKHTEVDCGFQVVPTQSHGVVVQLDTYGSDERKMLAKSSQSIQIDRKHAEQLITIFAEAFPGIV